MKRPAAFFGGIVALLGSAYIVVHFFAERSGVLAGDFRAFYCAAKIARTGTNPYLAHALAACESQKVQAMLFTAHAGVVIPAPLPGYGIAFFLPFTVLSFGAAALCWSTVLLGAVVASMLLLRRLTGLPGALIVAALALSAGLTSLWTGQLVPIVLLALVAAGWFLRCNKPHAAAIAALVSTIEPHVGLPACLALFVWCRQSRIPLLLGGSVLAAISIALLGVGVNVAYFTKVLPAHIAADRSNLYQYSLTWVLHAMGARDGIATLAGELSYAALLVIGVVLARPIARTIHEPAAIVLLPPALVLFGGTYMHITQMCLAVPITLLLLARSARRYRAVLTVALAALAIPWLTLLGSPLTAILASVVAAICLRPAIRHERVALAAMGAVAFFLLGASVWAARLPHPRLGTASALAGTSVSASAAWAHALAQNANAPNTAVYWIMKAPTWLGLLALLATVLAIAVERFGGEALFDSRSRSHLRGKFSEGRAS